MRRGPAWAFMLGGVTPDFDVPYFALFGPPIHTHHYYSPLHWPVAWLTLGAALLFLARRAGPQTQLTLRALLAGIAASPVLLDAAKVQKLGDRTSRQLRGGLAGCVAGWKQLEAMGLGPEARQGLLLILHQLYQHKLGGVRLTAEEVQQRQEAQQLRRDAAQLRHGNATREALAHRARELLVQQHAVLLRNTHA